jgi:uncharacterized coiled-coil protein SlyX
MTLAELVGLLGAAAAIIAVIGTIIAVTARLGKMTGTWEVSLHAQNSIIQELKMEIIELRRVVTDIAVFNARLAAVEQQQALQAKAIDELRHGEGYIIPRQRLTLGTPNP